MNESQICPLLENPLEYNPDTLDLMHDDEAKAFWLECFENLTNRSVLYAIQNCPNDRTANARAEQCKEFLIEAISKIRKDPLCFGHLSVRLLLDLNESCLRSHGFFDLWLNQKSLENRLSLLQLQSRLIDIDNIENQDDKWEELSKGLLAGNMFDWGAKAVSDILQSNSYFGLKQAKEKIQKRPWLVDGLDKWLERMKGPSHVCAVIFVDNSGIDIILGVLPFVRQLLIKKTRVIMCANSEPALNDVTHHELKDIILEASEICDILKLAVEDKNLIIMESGQKNPCLDLRTLNSDLCMAMIEKKVDLIIIEGMGRALHTNLLAKFKCESLKMAVVKNPWLAKRLGGEIFSVICQYEK